MHKKVQAPVPFEVLVGTYPYHTEPDRSPPLQPPHLRTAVLYGPIHKDGNANILNGLMDENPSAPATLSPATGTFTVSDNNFGTGRSVLVIGNFRLISNVDFVPGGGAAATATVIAASINRLQGYEATALGADVTVNYTSGPADEISFRGEHYGTVTNFDSFVPDNGYLDTGSPDIQPPVLT